MPTLEVFADVRCPFTHSGVRRLLERRREAGADVVLRFRAWPLELVNGEPLDPALVAEEVDAIRDQVRGDLFAGFDPGRFPATSLPALALADAAYGVDVATGEGVSLALRDACFEQGRDIADAEVLRQIAGAHGVGGPIDDQHGVVRDWKEGQERGVEGSPYYFVGEAGFFCPALHIEKVDGRFRLANATDEFEAFLARAFTGSN
ncbi:MAG TPA: DsbA family protein [Acidimicrobiales bacterium]|nr:DsbA family protein [Acidimicrobiales bacterium]